MFTGRHIHTIDEKGRVVLPVRIRNAFEGYDTCYIAPGTDGQITLNRPDEFEAYLRGVIADADTTAKRSAARLISQEAVVQKLDKAGRVLVPEHLRLHAGISLPSEVAITGAVTHAEIWRTDLNERDNALGRTELVKSEVAKEARGS